MNEKTRYFILTLKNETQNQSFKFKLRNTQSANIWWDRSTNAKATGFYEDDRFYGFPNHQRSELKNIIKQFDENILKLQNMHPELNIPKLDQSDLANSLNSLHLNFAHSHLVDKKIDTNNSNLWSQFNTLIHTIELLTQGKNFFKKIGIPAARIVYTMNDNFKVDIPEECYKEFCLNFKFGTVYFNYAQVGRQFIEMFRANDDQIDDRHIQPSRYFSADTSIWFGPSLGHDFAKSYYEHFSVWFKNREARFNGLGFYLNDLKLSLGHVPVADLNEPIDQGYKILEMQNLIAQFKKVESISFFEE